MPEFCHPQRLVIDRPYVVFTTQWGRHLLSGASLDGELKSRVLLINAEPVFEKTTIRIGEITTDVWIPKVTLRDPLRKDTLYQVVYDNQYVVSDEPTGSNEQFLVELSTFRSNTYDPVSRN